MSAGRAKDGSRRGHGKPWAAENVALLGKMMREPDFDVRKAAVATNETVDRVRDKIKQMERAMIGRKNDGLDFFPTPAGVADELVQAAGIEEGMSVLEPSARIVALPPAFAPAIRT